MTTTDSLRFEDIQTVPRSEENSEKNMVRGSRMFLIVSDHFANYFVSHKAQVKKKYNRV
jgi:hypothetical protein